MVLHHVTPKDRLAKIRREGLKPHVPGEVWGVCPPSVTKGRRVVWLTADAHEWRHDRHPNKKYRKNGARLLTVAVNWQDKNLHHYLSWADPKKRETFNGQQNLPAWFVYFGTIKPRGIVDGLRPRRKPRR